MRELIASCMHKIGVVNRIPKVIKTYNVFISFFQLIVVVKVGNALIPSELLPFVSIALEFAVDSLNAVMAPMKQTVQVHCAT